MGRPVISVIEVTEYEPGCLIRIETIESSFPIQVTRRVEAIEESTCRVHAEISGGPNTPRFLAPLVNRVAQRSVNADYDRLVALFI